MLTCECPFPVHKGGCKRPALARCNGCGRTLCARCDALANFGESEPLAGIGLCARCWRDRRGLNPTRTGGVAGRTHKNGWVSQKNMENTFT